MPRKRHARTGPSPLRALRATLTTSCISTTRGIGDGFGAAEDLIIKTGAGVDTVSVFSSPNLLGNVDIQTYDSLSENQHDMVWIGNIVAKGDLRVRQGGGSDTFHLDRG